MFVGNDHDLKYDEVRKTPISHVFIYSVYICYTRSQGTTTQLSIYISINANKSGTYMYIYVHGYMFTYSR